MSHTFFPCWLCYVLVLYGWPDVKIQLLIDDVHVNAYIGITVINTSEVGMHLPE